MDLKIAVLSGDGIGPEVNKIAVQVLEIIAHKLGHEFEFVDGLVGAIAIDKNGNPLPDETLALCKKSDAVLFGAIGDPKYDNNPDAKVRPEQGLLKLRKELDLFANIRPIKTFDDLIDQSPLKKHIVEGVDMVIYRELTGGLYFGKKQLSADGKTASDLCQYHEFEIARITHLAFQAAQNRRKKVTLVDKANVLETSRLWRKVVKKIAENYPDVQLDFLFVDNCAMQMILNPKQFDIILTENLFGDIISDQGSVIGGSIGILPSASIGTKHAMFEPIHGSFPQAKGLNIANPIAAVLSAATLLEHFKLFEEAKLVEKAIDFVLKNKFVTKDLDSNSVFGTKEVGQKIIDYIYN
jgi:3-isopropylmalate dehydrogenase